MQEKIIEHLQETYKPDAIILHGSRARGKERERSDWDIIFLYSQATEVKNGRELFEGQNIEYSVCILPVSDIFEQFWAKLQSAKVLYEKSGEGTALLQQAADYYAAGVHWTEEKKADHKLWMEGRVNGMKDNTDNPIVFNKYFSDFYSRVFNYWYWILQHHHSQPIYIATDEVTDKDPEYHALIASLVSQDISLEEKAKISEEIYLKIFG